MKRILSMIAVLFSTIIFAQTTVTGSVSGEDNNPIPGANVVVDAMTRMVFVRNRHFHPNHDTNISDEECDAGVTTQNG